MSDDEASEPAGTKAGSPPEGSDEHRGRQLVERIAEYDTDLAHDVRRILARGAQLHDATDELQADLEERNDQIQQLEADLRERDERIQQLEEKLDGADSGPSETEAADGHTTTDGDAADQSAADADAADQSAADADAADQSAAGDDGEQADGEPADTGKKQPDADRQERAERIDELEADLQEREEEIEDLQAEIDDLKSRLKRKQADFENYKGRAERKREQIKERATEELVERLLDVRDNLRRALENEHADVEDLREGVRMTLQEFDRVLDGENVSEIAPDPGESVDPQRHEVMMRVDSDQPEDTVAELFAPGYRMADKVIRAAQVTVSTGPADEADDEESGDEDEASEDESQSAAAAAQGNDPESDGGAESDGDDTE